jgi:hypothetical protein
LPTPKKGRAADKAAKATGKKRRTLEMDKVTGYTTAMTDKPKTSPTGTAEPAKPPTREEILKELAANPRFRLLPPTGAGIVILGAKPPR